MIARRRPHRRHLLLAALILVMVAASGLAQPANDARSSFKRGIEAMELNRFDDAIEALNEAIARDGKESEQRVFLSGVFSRPYLPHAYLGLAHIGIGGVGSGNDSCRAALSAFEASESQGVVQSFRSIHAEVESARDACRQRVLPPLRDAARAALGRAEALAQQYDEPLPDRALESERQSALRQLASARERRSEADSDDRASTWSQVQAAANYSVAAFESLQRDLRLLASAEPNPEATTDDPRNPATEPQPATAQPIASQPIPTQPNASPPIASPPNASPPTASPPTPIATAPPSRSDPTISRALTELGRAVSRARETLDHLDAAESPSVEDFGPLLAGQYQRLGNLLEAAGQRQLSTNTSTERIEDLRHRILESLGAVELLAASDALINGDSRRALMLLGNAGAPTATDPPLAAQAYLFRAAARHHLFSLGGEVDDDLERDAARDIERCRQLQPGLLPAASIFSPRFRQLFDTPQTQNR